MNTIYPLIKNALNILVYTLNASGYTTLINLTTVGGALWGVPRAIHIGIDT